jgi:hypothetical protein
VVSRRRVTGFWDRRGVWHELDEPDRLATWKQLYRLNALGQLDVVPHRHQVEPITMAEAAAAIADAEDEDW